MSLFTGLGAGFMGQPQTNASLSAAQSQLAAAAAATQLHNAQQVLANQLGMQTLQNAAFGGQIGQFFPGLTQPPQAPPDQSSEYISIVRGLNYEVFYAPYVEHYMVALGGDKIMLQAAPTRTMIAELLKQYRDRKPRVGARCPTTGMLQGVRFFKVASPITENYWSKPTYRLLSPFQNTVWNSAVLEATNWNENSDVRNHPGIHAAWPVRNPLALPRVDIGRVPGFYYAEVRGYGKFVAGDKGWRAQRCIIDRVYYNPRTIAIAVLRDLCKNYPEVSFEEEPWTSAKLLKLEK